MATFPIQTIPSLLQRPPEVTKATEDLNTGIPQVLSLNTKEPEAELEIPTGTPTQVPELLERPQEQLREEEALPIQSEVPEETQISEGEEDSLVSFATSDLRGDEEFDIEAARAELRQGQDEEDLYISSLIQERRTKVNQEFADGLTKALAGDSMDNAEDEYFSTLFQAKIGALEVIETPRILAAAPTIFNRWVTDTVFEGGPKVDENLAKQLKKGQNVFGAFGDWLADSVLEGKTLDAIAEREGREEIEKEFNVKIPLETIEDAALTRGVLTTIATLGLTGLARTGIKEGVKGFTKETTKKHLKTQVVAAGITAGSIKTTQEVLKQVRPESPESQFLLAMATGLGTGVVIHKGGSVALNFLNKTPTAVIVNAGKKGAKAIWNGGVLVKDAYVMRREAKRRKVPFEKIAEESYENSSAGQYFKSLYAKLKDRPETVRSEVEAILQKARENPGGVEHSAVQAVFSKLMEDEVNIDKAINLADTLTTAFSGENLNISAFDTYNGIFKAEFVKLHNSIDPKSHLARWEGQINSLKKSIEVKEIAETHEIQAVNNAAALVMRNVNKVKKAIDDEQALVLQDHVIDINDKLLQLTEVDGVSPISQRVGLFNNLRSSLDEVSKVGNSVVDTLYAAVDPQAKLRTNEATLVFNDILNDTVRKSVEYPQLIKMYNKSIFDYLNRTLDDSSAPLPDLINRKNQPVQDPNTFFTEDAVSNTDGRVVYMSVNQFQKLTKGLSTEEAKAIPSLTEGEQFNTVPGITLDLVDSQTVVTSSVGRAEANAVKGLKGNKDTTLIPVSIKSGENISIESLIKKPLIPVVKEGGTGKPLDVRLQGQIKNRNLSDRVKRAELEVLAEHARTKGFVEQGGLGKASEIINLDNMELTYREARDLQIQLRRKANNTVDPALKQVYQEKVSQFDTVVDTMVQSDAEAAHAYNVAQGTYRDFVIPDFKNTTKGIIGKINSFTRDNVESKLMSTIFGEILTKPELQEQLVQLTEPQRFSMFKELVSSPDNMGKLAFLNDIMTKGTKEQIARLPKTGDDIKKVVAGILLDDVLNTYITRKAASRSLDATELFNSIVSEKLSNPMFKAIIESDADIAPFFKDLENAALDPDIHIPWIARLQKQNQEFDHVFFNNIEQMRKGNTHESILRIVENQDQLTMALSKMVGSGHPLAGTREFMISSVLRESLKWDGEVLNIKHLKKSLDRYGEGLDRLTSGFGADNLKTTVENLLKAAEAIGDRPSVHASLDLERFSGLIGTFLNEAPTAVSNYLHAKKWGLNKGYIATMRVAAFAKKRIAAMETQYSKLTTEIAIETMLNPKLFKQLREIAELTSKRQSPEVINRAWKMFELDAMSYGATQLANILRSIHELEEMAPEEDEEALNKFLQELKNPTDEAEVSEIQESLGVFNYEEYRKFFEEPEDTVVPEEVPQGTIAEELLKTGDTVVPEEVKEPTIDIEALLNSLSAEERAKLMERLSRTEEPDAAEELMNGMNGEERTKLNKVIEEGPDGNKR